MTLKQRIKTWLFERRLQKAIARANHLQATTHRKHLVLLIKGRPQVISKQQLTRLVRRGYFVRGIRLQDLERKALYITL